MSKIEISSHNGQHAMLLDDVDVGHLIGVDPYVTFGRNELATVHCTLHDTDLAMILKPGQVELSDETKALLVSLGWTPPA